MKYLSLLILAIACTGATTQDLSKSNSNKVTSLKITTLSTMLANQGIGEWGYAALIEVDGHKILFDTGNKPETVLQNSRELGVDLTDVEDVFISHNHGDHVGGLLTLRAELKKQNPNALKRIHVGKGIFLERVTYENKMLNIKEVLEQEGMQFIEYESSKELLPGVWVTGPVERIHSERNWSGNGKIRTEEGEIEDNIPEDQSLVIATTKGFVLISGCGHAGIVNTMEHIRSDIYDDKIFAAIGGFHLLSASDEHLHWTANQLTGFGVSMINGAHCTGINALFTLRTLMDLDRTQAVVGSVGDHFDLEKGISPGFIAK